MTSKWIEARNLRAGDFFYDAERHEWTFVTTVVHLPTCVWVLTRHGLASFPNHCAVESSQYPNAK